MENNYNLQVYNRQQNFNTLGYDVTYDSGNDVDNETEIKAHIKV